MHLSSNIRHGRHCVVLLHVHLVFVTKYRGKVFDSDAIERLKIVFQKVCLDFEAELVEVNGEAEHVQLLINYPPKHSVSSLVNSLKGVSSRLLRRERPDIEKRYWKNVLWSPSYFAASCGGAPLNVLKQYVEQQKTPL
jgi:putative transposase